MRLREVIPTHTFRRNGEDWIRSTELIDDYYTLGREWQPTSVRCVSLRTGDIRSIPLDAEVERSLVTWHHIE